ncbi:hypothetical protein SCANM124S_00196 [Streptomyces canus]
MPRYRPCSDGSAPPCHSRHDYAAIRRDHRGDMTFNGAILETNTHPFRLDSTRARTEDPAKAG